jgi:TP901 family phage tail tape measure protein
MSSFSAGAITGGIKFDISEFTHGMLHAEAISHAFPEIVVAFMEEPLLALTEIAKEAGRAIFEAFEGTGHLFDDMSREALKAGMTVKTFSSLVAAAKPDNLGIAELGNAIKFMLDRAGSAMSGDAGALKAFTELGIKTRELKELMKDPEALMMRVADAFHRIESPAKQVEYALNLMSRAGADMLPFLKKGSAGIRELADEMADLGGAVDESQGEMGEKFSVLEGKISAAWIGIKKAVGEPILKELTDHIEDVEPALRSVTHWLRDELGQAMRGLVIETSDAWPALKQMGSALRGELTEAIHVVAPIVRELLSVFKSLGEAIGPLILPAIRALDSAIKSVAETLRPTLTSLRELLNSTAAMPDWYHPAELTPAAYRHPNQSRTMDDPNLGTITVHLTDQTYQRRLDIKKKMDDATVKLVAKIEANDRRHLITHATGSSLQYRSGLQPGT